jgi:hypothetical protein
MKNGLIRTSSRALLLSTLTLAAFGCADVPDEVVDPSEDVGEAQGEIQNGTAPDLWTRARVASLDNCTLGKCTATIIGPRHLLTAARCAPEKGGHAIFYTSNNPDYVAADGSTARTIDAVSYPPGVDVLAGDYTDVNGKFADIAVVRLSSNIPATSAVATLAWSYPSGGDDWGLKVGAGRHNGYMNDDADLRGVPDQTYSDNGSGGHFLTENAQNNVGDAGGPFFYSNRVLGALSGTVFEWEYRDKYTSVPLHLDWILKTIGYTFPGTTTSNVSVLGGLSSIYFTSSSKVCSYICDKTSSCVAFTYTPTFGQCELKNSNSGSFSFPGATSGVK